MKLLFEGRYKSYFMNIFNKLVKIRLQAKISNFTFKNSNIIIGGIISKREDYFPRKTFEKQKNYFINTFYFCSKFFLITSIEPNFFK